MLPFTWQKSSYCAQGEACVHISETPTAIHLTESADPTKTILSTTPSTFEALLNALKSSRT
ncbi:DUF397 domain-containing protein [Streptomyces regalis]|uniref:DUF397 domain-containing protein n=1 Tax=Streptomyces regalis TaxID=68262 RepID=UPI00099F140E|nr:DUF397 domain-containing protein [Streptomyces regalis]